MQLFRRTSRYGGLPDLYSFYCLQCEECMLKKVAQWPTNCRVTGQVWQPKQATLS